MDFIFFEKDVWFKMNQIYEKVNGIILVRTFNFIEFEKYFQDAIHRNIYISQTDLYRENLPGKGWTVHHGAQREMFGKVTTRFDILQ